MINDLLKNVIFKKLKGKNFRNVGILTISNFVASILSFLQGIIVAKILGPSSYGIVALVMSYPSLVFSFFDAKSGEASIKYFSEFQTKGHGQKVLAMAKLGYSIDLTIALLALITVFLTGNWAAINIAHKPETEGLMLAYSVTFIPKAFTGTSKAWLTTLSNFSLIAWVEVIITFIRVCLIISFVFIGWEIKGVVWGNGITNILMGLVYGTIGWVKFKQICGAYPSQGKWIKIKEKKKEIFSFVGYNNLSVLLGILTKQIDVLLLGYFHNPSQVGYYQLAKKLSSVVNFLVAPLQSVTYPELAKLLSLGNKQKFQLKIRSLAIKVGLPLGLIVLTSISLVPFFVTLLVGKDYIPAIKATQLLLIGQAFWLTFFWLRPLFLARVLVKEWTICTLIFSLFTMLGWIIIVPTQGYLGMSLWWSLSTMFVYTIPPLIILKKLDIRANL